MCSVHFTPTTPLTTYSRGVFIYEYMIKGKGGVVYPSCMNIVPLDEILLTVLLIDSLLHLYIITREKILYELNYLFVH
jgi:hypothetical protein